MRCFSSLNSALLAHWMTIDGRHRFTFLRAGSLWSLPKIFFFYCLRIISTALHWHRIQYSSFLSFLSLPYDLARDMLLSPYIITRSCEEKTRALTCTKKNGTCGNEVATKSRIPTALFFLYTLLCWRRGHDRFLRQFLTEWSCWKWNFIILWSCTANSTIVEVKPSRWRCWDWREKRNGTKSGKNV